MRGKADSGLFSLDMWSRIGAACEDNRAYQKQFHVAQGLN